MLVAHAPTPERVSADHAPAVAAAPANADDVRSWQEELYRDLPSTPNCRIREHRTAAAVADRLQQTGFEVTTGVSGTGVVGILRNGEGATVLLRADMDALPVLEDTGLPYASTATGRQTPRIRPPCAGRTRLRSRHAHHLPAGRRPAAGVGPKERAGTLIALFQPAGGTANGAQGDGRRRAGGVGRPRRRRARPARGAAACQRPRRQAGSILLRSRLHPGDGLTRRSGHASMPQACVDPVVLAASTIVCGSRRSSPAKLQARRARRADCREVTAGTKANIIADRAELQINIRTHSEATRFDDPGGDPPDRHRRMRGVELPA